MSTNKQSGPMMLKASLRNQGYAELVGDQIKYWAGYGVHDFEGPIESFMLVYPKIGRELVSSGFVRSV